MATFVLTITVDDSSDFNGGVRTAAYELSERILEDVKPSRMEVDEAIDLFGEDGAVQAELMRSE
ncbi:hypothetical protein [Stenotrophomonas phage vB_SmaS_BUCT548]|uniref:Uncharacterized protein n=1 Tax=Stenotrophomonas phage vB_SmaS_BUCT548 TaxID=2712941 RepID=A0A7D2HHV6_9CAUD|nr:hypothetical protein PQD75_gp078 [Stenotrophomonas phage vB_SmaS_BUCT548]QIQ60794.1 hypothetical protein [Stenotrophomonas phage vB_SmaS_BUCT548]